MTTPDAHNPSNPAHLPVVLLIAFLGSSGTAIVTTGIAFIAEQGLGYGARMNLLLALGMGLVYTPAAFLSGATLRKLIKRSDRVTSRGFLLALLLIEVVVCQLPILAQRLAPDLVEPALWVMALVFMVATGLQWPIVESYFSGGRREKALRKAVGHFNICWSGAMVLSYWFMAPLLEHHPFVIISALGALHVLIAGIAWKLPREPAKHLDTGASPHPPIYETLLREFRVLIVASYVVIATMSPMLPSIQGQLGIATLWLTPIASVWLVVRVVMFGIFQRYHFWHGKRSTPWIGLVSMILGFTLTMLSPAVGSILFLVVGLTFVGIGIAIIYLGSLYYALSVGSSDVDSGGTHEGLIGLGYTLGPLCGLGAGFMTRWEPGAREQTTILITVILVALMLGIGLRMGRPRG